jgi:hypothetical protein
MAVTTKTLQLHPASRRVYRVIHPLDDVVEPKADLDRLGPMQLTRTVKACLYVLRGYLILVSALLAVHVLRLAGVI